MINQGLIQKSIRDCALVTLGFAVLLLVVETLISFVIPEMNSEIFNMMVKLPFVRKMMGALLGVPITENMGTGLLLAIPWVHPVVLMIVFGHQVTLASQLPSGEIDRGTIDLLLGLPVNRLQVFFTHFIICSASGIVVLSCGVVGHLIGLSLAKADPPPLKILMIAFANAYAIYFSICGLGILISSLSERRGRAIGAVMTLVVSSFMINFIAEYWEPASIVKPFSLLTYYRPLITLQSETFPIGDITILSSIGLVSALAGAWVFNRRDIQTT